MAERAKPLELRPPKARTSDGAGGEAARRPAGAGLLTFEEIFERVPLGCLLTDDAGDVLEINAAARTLFRVPDGDKPSLLSLVDVDDWIELRQMLAHEGTRVERRVIHDERRVVLSSTRTTTGPLLWTAERATSDVVAAMVASQTAALARALQDKTELLERERATRLRLEQADSAKDRFLAALSHDLRAPVNAVLGWTQLLRKEILGRDARDRALAVIERNALAQVRLVDDLLDVARIATDRVQLEITRVDLASLVDGIVETLGLTADSRGLRLLLSACEPVVVWGDVKRLEQIVTNLLANSLKFSEQGAEIVVEVYRVEERAFVRVQDHGRGIAPDDLPHVFDRFRQGDSVAGPRDGLGLGLFIVRNLVRLHGGFVEAFSAGRGKGACFTVSLPASETDGPSAATAGC